MRPKNGDMCRANRVDPWHACCATFSLAKHQKAARLHEFAFVRNSYKSVAHLYFYLLNNPRQDNIQFDAAESWSTNYRSAA